VVYTLAVAAAAGLEDDDFELPHAVIASATTHTTATRLTGYLIAVETSASCRPRQPCRPVIFEGG
jgi:hypothetical protein